MVAVLESVLEAVLLQELQEQTRAYPELTTLKHAIRKGCFTSEKEKTLRAHFLPS